MSPVEAAESASSVGRKDAQEEEQREICGFMDRTDLLDLGHTSHSSERGRNRMPCLDGISESTSRLVTRVADKVKW